MTPHADRGEGVSSELVGMGEPRELVVVGFVQSDWRVGGSVAYVSTDEPAMGPSSPVRAWASTTGYHSEDELLADVTGASPDVSAATNRSLLMYQGISVGAAIQDTLVAGWAQARSSATPSRSRSARGPGSSGFSPLWARPAGS